MARDNPKKKAQSREGAVEKIKGYAAKVDSSMMKRMPKDFKKIHKREK